MFVIKHKTFFLIFSTAVTLACLVLLIFVGLPYGIDFKGGALLEARFFAEPTHAAVRDVLAPLNLGDITIQSAGENSLILRFKEINEDTHQKIVEALKYLDKKSTSENAAAAEAPKNEKSAPIEIKAVDSQGKDLSVGGLSIEAVETVSATATVFEELRFESVGPAIGAELKQKAKVAVVLAIVAIVIYVAWAFRHVSKPVASWKYGLITIIALIHDISLPLGIFAVLGFFGQAELSAPFIAALLTILGYSVNDTIVVFDRVRENLLRDVGENFSETIGLSLRQTVVRSLNTTFTTLLALFAVFFFGGATVQMFALALIIGIAAGAYSSIFIACPLLVLVEERQRK